MTIHRKTSSRTTATPWTATRILLVLLLSYGCIRDVGGAPEAGLRESIEVAKIELARDGYLPPDMVVEADKSNLKWQAFLRSTPGFASDHPGEMAKLNGKKYWAVYFSPRPIPNTLQGGGDAFVFVDAETRTVLTVILFK